MPHCIIEHSSTINAEKLNTKVFLGALNSELFEADGRDIKVRSIAYENYQTGTEKEDFIHVTVRILSGRSDTDKAMLSETVMTQLLSMSLSRTSITVEVADMDRNCYGKVVV
ncbi:5-carboxymethyl-2-hydroxymuconate Delta-isomerase [Vibrio chagasii]|uniref:5-carboxymethyl-2-hydroxymuconate Delta-isomerase n=1 Tax=Vibrio chagasii TaxID=170679 RepID=UPI002283B2B2|nr:5-carboxymethyl-2-hydroxymuconate isomerase [Vibrio chagasii]MCY9826943.1 5-carboxymethyl-2-hydroxymuconate isomerase [Vibrio chagasii]